jgi:tetratricopeptide (TPR) repeat protein
MFGEAIYLWPGLMTVCLLLVLAIRPAMRLLNVWWTDCALPDWQLACWLAGHLLVLLLCLYSAWWLACAYLLVVNGYWLFEPRIADRRRQRRAAAIVDAKIARLERIAAVNPEIAPYHAALADACMECGRYDEAIIEYEMAIALLPDHSRQARCKLQRAMTERKRGHQTGQRVFSP